MPGTRRITGAEGMPGTRMIEDQRGVTGLETAIILIAFVVVASVFAFTVLSTGIFSAERGKETVQAGLSEASSSLMKTSGMVAYGVSETIVTPADISWSVATSSVSSTPDSLQKKRGGSSTQVTVQTAHITGLAAWEDTPGIVNLSDQTQLRLWIRSTTTTVDGQLEIILDEDAACISPEAEIHIPGLAANAWTLVTAAITQTDGVTPVANQNKDQIVCVGLDVKSDLSTSGDVNINLDQLVGAGEITKLVFNVAGVLDNEPVFVLDPSDADGDGLGDADSEHTLIVSYFDRNQLVRDLVWTGIFLGSNDGDLLLEAGERAEITILLAALDDATPLSTDEVFTLEIKPAEGSVLTVQRRTPKSIDPVMTLE
jgi:flagellin-like protein